MNLLLWVFQGLLALLFLATGTMLLITPRDKITERTTWVEAFSPGFIKFVGLLEVLGATGLVAPLATSIWPQLTPLAAGGLALLMIGAVATHLRYREYLNALLPLVVLLLASFIVYGRVLAVSML